MIGLDEGFTWFSVHLDVADQASRVQDGDAVAVEQNLLLVLGFLAFAVVRHANRERHRAFGEKLVHRLVTLLGALGAVEVDPGYLHRRCRSKRAQLLVE